MSGDAPRSALDEAWAARVAGRAEDSIRAAMAVLAADDQQLAAAALLLELLADAGRDGRLQEAGTRLVDGFIRRGNLPRALAVTVGLAQSGIDTEALRREIAIEFGHGSDRLGDVSPAPPPLPAPTEIGGAEGDALLDAAEAILRVFLMSDDAIEADRPVPRLPLFSALEAESLEQLLGVWDVVELGPDEAAIEEGAEGRDAFVVVRGRLRAQRGSGDDATILAELGPGALFGEMALVSDSPRAASVIANEPVQLLVAHRSDLEKLAKRTPEIGRELSSFCRARMVSNLMRHSSILKAVPPGSRNALMERFESRSFSRGDHLVKEGAETEGLFLIASGNVKVMSQDSDGDLLQVAELGPGDVVGEISLVLRRPATADVIATHRTVALELEREQFQAAIKEHPTLLGELYELATKREEEMRTVVAQETLDVEEIVLL